MARPPRPRKSVRDLLRSPRETAPRPAGLRLDKNENLAPAPALLAALTAGLRPEDLATYPDYAPFTEKLARWLGCGPENLLLSAGSDGVIKLLFESYLEPGKRVVVLDPSFAMFDIYARMFGGRMVKVPFEKDLSLRPEKLLKAIRSGVGIVAIANPNNPTGTVLEEEVLLAAADKAEKAGALFLMDEAYYYFTRRTFFPHVLKRRNVLLTRTFSKACGLAALRLGYAYGPPDLIEGLRKCQSMFEVNAFALRAAGWLIDNESVIWDYAAEVRKGQELLARGAGALGARLLPSEGNAALLDLGRDSAPVASRLKAAGVLVGAGYRHPALLRCVKVTLGPAPVMEDFLGRLREALR